MEHAQNHARHQQRLLRRFWKSAAGFWSGRQAWRAWLLCALLIAIVIGQLLAQYWLNYWNRDFFDALEQRNAAALVRAIWLFFPLAALAVVLATLSVWGRMTAQRLWRRYLTAHAIDAWLANGHYRSLGHLNGTSNAKNPEYRIAEDARMATDAPIDLVLALISSVLTGFVFFGVLASVGGSLTFEFAGASLTIPAYLSVSVLVYSGAVTAAVMLIGRQYTSVVQDQVQAEAVFRASANLIRESGEGFVVNGSEKDEVRDLWESLRNVIEQWRRACWQHMRITLVSHSNLLLAPVVGLMLCVPKYMSADMTLGEVTQAAAAFVVVQGAFNWLVDNFQRMADWRSSANRIAALLLALDELKDEERRAPAPAAPLRSAG